MSNFKNTFLIFSAVVFLLVTGFCAGFFSSLYFNKPNDKLPILSQAYEILINNGLRPIPPDPALEYGMIQGMIEAYGDPFTSFAEPAQHELETQNLHGSYGGIGASIGKDIEGYYILFPFPDSPAVQGGVLDGDRLLAVDRLQVQTDTPQDILLAAIRGPVGQPVILTIARPPEYQPIQLSIERAEISLPSVTWNLAPADSRLGIIKVNLIADSTPDEIRRAVTDLKARGATHFALDLRDNYGGLLEAGVDTARLFLKDGIVIEKQFRGQESEAYKVEHIGPLSDIPLVVFVNQNTASAAEIIAGALRVHQRATIIGIPTYGKDTIQLIFELKDGSSMHITAARWWIPGLDFPIEGLGLRPDILLSPDSVGDDQYINSTIQFFFGQY
jgi:carboxyl-terminal processing protease